MLTSTLIAGSRRWISASPTPVQLWPFKETSNHVAFNSTSCPLFATITTPLHFTPPPHSPFFSASCFDLMTKLNKHTPHKHDPGPAIGMGFGQGLGMGSRLGVRVRVGVGSTAAVSNLHGHCELARWRRILRNPRNRWPCPPTTPQLNRSGLKMGRKWVESGSKVGQWERGSTFPAFINGNFSCQLWNNFRWRKRDYSSVTQCPQKLCNHYHFVLRVCYAGYCVRFSYWTLIRGFDSAG